MCAVVEALNPAAALADLSLTARPEATQGPGASKRYRFLRLKDLDVDDLGQLSREQLELMLFSQRQALASSRWGCRFGGAQSWGDPAIISG